MWEIEFLVSTGRMRSHLSPLLEELATTSDSDRASRLIDLVESAVAPVSGGVAEDVGAVVTVVVACIPRMSSVARSGALRLLAQIVGSIETESDLVAREVGKSIEAAMPTLAAIVEDGPLDVIAPGIDLISLSSSLGRLSAERAAFYLSQIVKRSVGAVRDSAERELDDVNALIASQH